MSPTVTSRIAGWAALTSIVDLLNDDELGRTRNPVFADAAEAYRDAFAHLVDNDDNNVVVAESDGRIVSCYQLTFIRGLSRVGGLRAQIESVRVTSDLRGQGLGSALMRDAIDRARARNCTLIQLTTDTRRADTRRFYERLGFVASHHGMKQFL
jgi:ribosomal protein S18 acetylase RimI-like enzyme